MEHLPCALRKPPAERFPRWGPWGLSVGLLTGFLLALVVPAQAQEGPVGGVVVSEQTLRPLEGAQVQVLGTERGTITDARGRFLIPGLSGPEVTLRVIMLGYRTAQQTVRVGDVNARIVLSETAIELDALVVTGTPGAVQKRAIGNAVATIKAADVLDLAPAPTFQALVNARAPNVVILPGTGMLGSGARIRIRGASSLSLSNNPLIYVDGVRVDNEQATGPAVQAFGSSVISRWNDFTPEDIESIEIIRGPAAATLYGTEAAAGVIQIITKKGRAGRPVWNLTLRQGAQWFANAEGRVPTNYWRNPQTGEVESLNLVQLERERAERGEIARPIFTTGRVQGYHVNVSGGTQELSYYIGADYDNQTGVEPTNRLRRFSGRTNLSLRPSPTWDLAVNLGYTTGRTLLSCEAGCGGVTWGSYFSTPANLYVQTPPRRGYRSYTSDAYWELFENFQDLARFTGSIQVNHRPTPWFTQRLTAGIDEVREDNESITENSPMLAIWAPGSLGGKTVSRRDAIYHTVDYSASASLAVTDALSSKSSLGLQYYRKYFEYVTAEGSDFALPGLRAVSATARRNAYETFVENVTVGLYVEQQFGWKDRLFLTGALRADDNSAFGDEFDVVYYPKASVAWVVSEEPFWKVPFVNTLRLRSAYGQSGQQPSAFAAVQIFGAATAAGDVPTVTPAAMGNPKLGPERGEEIEVGLEAGLFDDRLGLEFTAYDKRTKDAILTRRVAPSTGFPGEQDVNAGEIKNQGFEAMMRGRVLDRENLDVDLTLSRSHNTSEVLSLGGEESLVVSTFGVEHRVGYPVGAWFHRRIVSAELDPTTGKVKPGTMMCDAGPGKAPVPCFTGTTITAPMVFLGQTLPKNEGAVSTTLTLFERVRLYALVDFKTGFRKWDHVLRVRCSLFNLCRENMYPTEYDPVTIAAYQNADRFGAAYINDASYAKLREVSASYTLPAAWVQRFGASRASVTLAGRNLYTWTKWTGMEPEAMFLAGARGGFVQLEQNHLPQLTQFVTTVNVNF